MCTNNTFILKFLCIGGEVYSDMDKICSANFVYATPISIICTCINIKQLETNNQLFNIYIR